MADINSGRLIFTCALVHKAAFKVKNYIPALGEFKKRLMILTTLHRWRYTTILDGRLPTEKRHKHERCRAKALVDDGVAVFGMKIMASLRMYSLNV